MPEIWQPTPSQSKMALNRCDFLEAIVDEDPKMSLEEFIAVVIVSAYWQGASDMGKHILQKQTNEDIDLDL